MKLTEEQVIYATPCPYCFAQKTERCRNWRKKERRPHRARRQAAARILTPRLAAVAS